MEIKALYQCPIQEEFNESPIQLLPDEIVLKIFNELKESDFSSISLVLWRWNHLSKDNFLWRLWLKQDFPFLSSTISENYRKEYKKQRKIHLNIQKGICEQKYIVESQGCGTYPKFVGKDELIYIDMYDVKKMNLKTNKSIREKTFSFLPRKIEEYNQLLFVIGMYEIEVLDASTWTGSKCLKVNSENAAIFDTTIQGDFLFASVCVNDILCWKISTGEMMCSWKCPDSTFPSVKSTEEFLVYGDRFGAVQLWNFQSEKWSEKYYMQESPILHMCVERDRVYTADYNKGVYSFDFKTKEIKHLVKTDNCYALHVAEGLLFIGRDFTNILEVWDLQTMKKISSYKVDPSLNCVGYREGFLLTSTFQGSLNVRDFNLSKKRPLKKRRLESK